MKITVCGSLRFVKEMDEVRGKLKEKGHIVLMPQSAIEKKDYQYWNKLKNMDKEKLSKIHGNRIKLHFNKIKSSEAILVLNYTKDGKENYIGANTFLEMGHAFSANKPIFVLNPLPKDHHHEELVAMNPICLDGNLNKITN